ncbi:acyl-CoA thioesterase domain-containing protein [Nocardia sp. NPDC005978]|uniref:acyl-CoA thioesterase n=1 Tax=Nocardia sp. NPDC005978 TaxID=3156725 RepID=UPI0033ADBA4C
MAGRSRSAPPAGADSPTREWDQAELLRLMDVRPEPGGRYLAPAHGPTERNVVEAGQLLGTTVVAAAKAVPGQRVTSVSMVFSRVATHDAPLSVALEVPHAGRTLSTVQARVIQAGKQCAAGVVLLDADTPDLIRSALPMPEVTPPHRLRPLDIPGGVVRGRDMRVVDDAYDPYREQTGPPELFVWTRFRQSPDRPELHAALLAQSTTHWTVAAALRPHPGFSEAMAHHSISTGITMATITFHDEANVSAWLLYATRVVYAGRGHAQSEGRIYTEQGAIVASYGVHAMVRAFPASGAPDSGTRL